MFSACGSFSARSQSLLDVFMVSSVLGSGLKKSGGQFHWGFQLLSQDRQPAFDAHAERLLNAQAQLDGRAAHFGIQFVAEVEQHSARRSRIMLIVFCHGPLIYDSYITVNQKIYFSSITLRFVLPLGMSESSKPVPIALPNGLLKELSDVADQMEMSRAELMRLCIRIGLVDLKAARHDLPGIVKEIADDKGVSFEKFAQQKMQQQKALDEPALNARLANEISGSVTFRTPAGKKSTLVLNEALPPPPELESNRLRRRLDAAARRGSGTR